MKAFFVLVIGLVVLAGCAKKEEAASSSLKSSSTATVQTAPGVPANANKPLTDGRVDKASESGPGGPSVGGK